MLTYVRGKNSNVKYDHWLLYAMPNMSIYLISNMSNVHHIKISISPMSSMINVEYQSSGKGIKIKDCYSVNIQSGSQSASHFSAMTIISSRDASASKKK